LIVDINGDKDGKRRRMIERKQKYEDNKCSNCRGVKEQEQKQKYIYIRASDNLIS